MQIQLLLTGNEIMAGDITDTNSEMIAHALAARGWRVHRRVTVGDDLPLLVSDINDMCEQADVLIINGGLGPTVDDLTAEALANASGRNITEHSEAMEHLHAWCAKRRIRMNDANHKQAMLPEGCDLLYNERGSAPGILMTHKNCVVMATPGVPSELKAMLSNAIMPILEERFEADHIITRRLAVFGRGESSLQQDFSTEFPDWPAHVELGFRASMPALEVKLTIREEHHLPDLELWQQRVIEQLAESYLGPAPSSPAQALVETLDSKKVTVALAESCTGGMIASDITAISGASRVFSGGCVVYSNAMKSELLGVDANVIERDGAVSESVVTAMLEGLLERTAADIGLAVTGIAGPDGGTDEKPVGTVWLAWGALEDFRTERFCLPMPRRAFQQWVTAIALDLLRRHALGITTMPFMAERYKT